MNAVLLYYHFAPIADHALLRELHAQFCRDHEIVGRIHVAPEGLNGTCAGSVEAVSAYKVHVEAWPGFADIVWKEEFVSEIPFSKLRVRARHALVALPEEHEVDPHSEGGERMSPVDWREAAARGDVLLLDVRNGYEWDIGHFTNALRAPVDTFAEFPAWADEIDVPKETQILMYCTGGIRCEKFSGLLKRRGYDNVHQLDGGIVSYAKDQGGALFEGKCFVFDDRLSIDIGGAPNTWASCKWCGAKTTRHQNCANMDCNSLFICCEDCAMPNKGLCTLECGDGERVREFRDEHIHKPFKTKGFEKVVETASSDPLT
jgi:UPF0176 protein